MNSKKNKFKFKDEHGAVTLIAALMMTVLLGFAALCVDAGFAYHNKAELQNASDSAALAIVNTIGASMSAQMQDLQTDEPANPNGPDIPAFLSRDVKIEVQKYFEKNGITDFKFDPSKVGIEQDIQVARWYEREDKINSLRSNPNKTKALIFYKVVSSTDDVPGYCYVEIYAQKKSATFFGTVLGFDSLRMNARAAAKTDLISDGNPAVLDYQVVNINSSPQRAFNITGPFEKTLLKPILNVTEKIINSGLDILQNETHLIQWLMGGPTVCYCPNKDTCPGKDKTSEDFKKDGYGYIGLEEEFKNHGTNAKIKPYVCPYCGEEIPPENTNKVEANIITSSAVLNGAIHSNGYANIDIDTIRMRHWQNPELVFVKCIGKNGCGYEGTKKEFQFVDNGDGTVHYKCPNPACGLVYDGPMENGYELKDNYVVYKNGTAYCILPRLETQTYDSLKITGSSANDVYLIGNQVTGSNPPVFPTVRKSGIDDQAKEWDRDRENPLYRQFTYQATDPEHNKPIFAEEHEKVQLLRYMQRRYKSKTNKLKHINTPQVTKTESGSSYTVEFGEKLANGNTWSFAPTSGNLVITPSGTIGGVFTGCEGLAPWLTEDVKEADGTTVKEYGNRLRVRSLTINKGVTKIEENAFSGLVNISNIKLPDTVKEIGKNAFANCGTNKTTVNNVETPLLTSVTLPDKIEKIDKDAFPANVTTIYAVQDANGKFSEAVTKYLEQTGKKGEAKVSDDNIVTQNNKYNKVLNPYDILNEVDLGNKKTLPDAYKVFDDQHEFDFDFDNNIDGIKDLTSGKFTVSEYINNICPDKTKWDENNHFDISDAETNTIDDARIILDKIVTSYTNEVHALDSLDPKLGLLEYRTAFNNLFDIDVVAAIESRNKDIESILNNLTSTLNSTTKNYFAPDANPVDGYYDQMKPIYDDIIIKRIAKNQWLSGNTADGQSKAQRAYDQVLNNDPDLINNLIDENGCRSWRSVKASGNSFPIKAGDKIEAGWTNYNHKNDLIIPSSTSVYIKGYFNGIKGGARRDLTLRSGTEANPTVLIIGGDNKITDKSDANRRYGKVLYTSGSLYLGDNTILIVNGDIRIDGDHFRMGNNSHIICNGELYFPNHRNVTWEYSQFEGTGNDDTGMVDYWSIVSKTVNIQADRPNYCGIPEHSVMLTRDFTCSQELTHRGFLYCTNNANFTSLKSYTKHETKEGANDGYTSNIYIGNEFMCNGAATINGYMIVERKIAKCGDLNPCDGVTLVKGVMLDSTGNETKDLALAASYKDAITVDKIHPQYNCRLVARGPVTANAIGLGVEQGYGDASQHAVLYIDAIAKQSAGEVNALTVTNNIFFHERANMYIKGNVLINGSNTEADGNTYSLYLESEAFARISGRLTTNDSIRILSKALLNVESSITVGHDIRIGTASNDPEEFSNTMLTGIKASTIKFTNTNVDKAILHCYNGTVHVANSINPKIIGLDDNAYMYIGGDIGSTGEKLTYIKCWDNGKLFVKGSIYSKGMVGTLNDAQSACQIFVGGTLVADGGLYADYATDILVNGPITVSDQITSYCNDENGNPDLSAIRVGDRGTMYSKDSITYKSKTTYENGNIIALHVLYSDGKILNTSGKGDIHAGTPDYIRASNRSEPVLSSGLPHLTQGLNTYTIKIITKVPRDTKDLTYKRDANGNVIAVPEKEFPSYTPDACVNGSGKTLKISKDTKLVVMGDLYLWGNIENYGQIIVFGNIKIGAQFNKKDNGYVEDNHELNNHIKNYNLIYCKGNMELNCANKLGKKSNGLTLQNGSYTDSDARIYVGGNLITKAAIDNFAKMYVGGNIDCTWGLEGNTMFSHWGTGFDNNPNSVLLMDGTLNTHQGYKSLTLDRPSHTMVKGNSLMYVGKNLITSASLNIGNPKFTMGSMESGEEQYYHMNSDAYTGLESPYYHVCPKGTPGSLEVDYILPENLQKDHIYAGKIVNKTLDENGNLITSKEYFSGRPAKHVTYSPKNCYSLHNADYGFAYIKGKVVTGDSNAQSKASIGYIYNTIVYGKSVLFVEGKNLQNGEDALHTGYLYNYPYGRMYIGGRVDADHNDSDFKWKYSETPRWRDQSSFTNGDTAELWYYSRTWINGDLGFNKLDYSTFGGRKFVMHDTAKCFINGSCTPREYVEIGKPIKSWSRDSINGIKENETELQVNGDFTISNTSLKNSYITIFPRSTVNANGNVTITSLKDLTTDGIRLHHHSNLRAAGNIRAGSINVGSCSNVNAGKDMHSIKAIHIFDQCNINVGGNGGGDIISYIGKIDIGQHEKEQYKYNTWEENQKTSDSDNPSDFYDPSIGSQSNAEILKDTVITCPHCKEVKGTVNNKKFAISAEPNYMGYYEFTCSKCKKTFDESYPIFEDDKDTKGSSVFVNGTIKSVFSSLHLYNKTLAYANDSIRSYRSISIDKNAGLYVNPKKLDDNGILYDYEKTTGKLLDKDGNIIKGFYVQIDESKPAYGEIYYLNDNNANPITIEDITIAPTKPSTEAPNIHKVVTENKFFGFSVNAIPNEKVPPEDSFIDIFFNPNKNALDKTYGYLRQVDNLYYYDADGNKVYPTHKLLDSDTNKEIVIHYGINGTSDTRKMELDNGNNDFVGRNIVASTTTDKDNNTITVEHYIDLKNIGGTVTSYGPLTVDDNAQLYASSNITAYDKTYIGNDAIVYSEGGNFRSLKLISIGSLINGQSVCGFEMKHSTLYAGKNIYILSCADIEGGTIYAVGDVTFDSIYVKYKFDPQNYHTDINALDFSICSETGDVNFLSMYNFLGGFIYAPGIADPADSTKRIGGNLNVNGIYFEHHGAYIGDQVNINAFYIAFHRLPNLSVIDMKWARPGEPYLCEPFVNN